MSVFGGRVVDAAGDSLLAEFALPEAAVSSALCVQERVAALNNGLPAERHLRYRIGLHRGEVFADDLHQRLFEVRPGE